MNALKRLYYRNWFRFHPVRRWEYQIAKRLVRGNVLDAGCGNGALTRFFARRANSVTAVDLSEQSLAVARESNPAPNVTYAKADLARLSFPSATFDTVLCVSVLGQLGNKTQRDAVVRELLRVTKSGGTIFLSALSQYLDDLDVANMPGFSVEKRYCLKTSPLQAVMGFFLSFRDVRTLLSFPLYPVFWLDARMQGHGQSGVWIVRKN
ncbi:MAG: class I SAM-dependent methyltransferase [Candidatus Micrarchaeota archaeon]|nr:class I SAM-dependent methyltransferase [Candidatus Micrarchaeota archaeon]